VIQFSDDIGQTDSAEKLIYNLHSVLRLRMRGVLISRPLCVFVIRCLKSVEMFHLSTKSKKKKSSNLEFLSSDKEGKKNLLFEFSGN
jgi:hypothetical protein